MKKTFCRPISLTGLNGKRIRVSGFERGSALCALTSSQPVKLAAPQPIVGYCRHAGNLLVYVAGSMPAQLRSAVQEDYTHEEVLLLPLPAGIREIDLTDCRREFRVMVPPLSLAA
ncbi:hypothetical protein CDA63_11900 [Hymenobacter amundsenii]|uniref:Uncharacterized protein n=1 Tax=Hymenobacter amundsenii TaxID=2006685 RepID=A0A246FK14_9BACT|nr:hypothetical protein [Hymenobacter amundsenii]OWP62915.1 hypothetical protein CDA63_11900 [Hymenobacter amundsenii]